MSRILLIAFILTSSAWAIDSTEEAMILNQELQFLEEASKTGPAISINNTQTESSPSRAINDDSLEKRYFGTEEDTIQTRTAAPKRRSY